MIAESDYLRLREVVCGEYGITVKDIESRDRKRHSVFGRRIIAICLREMGYSLPEIGEPMGRNHTTVLRLIRDRPAGDRARRAVDSAKVEAMKLAELPPREPRVRLDRWSTEPRDTMEAGWRAALKAYAESAVYDREQVWEKYMRILFPHSWRGQAVMPPREVV